MTIPTDSQAAAPHCHARVITLSTSVMRFGAAFAPTHRPQRPVRVNTPPTQPLNCASIDPGCAPSSLFQNHGANCLACGESPLSAAAACCPEDYGDSQGWLCGNWGDRTMCVLVSRC